MSFALPLRRSTTATTARIQPSTTFICSQCRHATLLRRPKRPYQFTQLIAMSDGSTFTHRTSSPAPIYRSTRDTRNSLMWNPSSSKLASIEKDEAGRMAAFRARFGRGFDANNMKFVDPEAKKAAEQKEADAKAAEAEAEEEDDNLLDLISAFGQQEAPPPEKKNKW